jgi:hypothetical protein
MSTAGAYSSLYTTYEPVACDGFLLILPEQEPRRNNSGEALDPGHVLGFSLPTIGSTVRPCRPTRSAPFAAVQTDV